MIIIRKAEEEDIKNISFLQQQFAETHYNYNNELYIPKEKFSEIWKKYAKKCLTRKDKLFLIAEENSLIAGYIIATISKRPPIYKLNKIGTIDAITVDKNHRKKGIASQLLKNCLEWFKNNKIIYVEAFIDVNNKASLELNKKFGFYEYQKRMIKKIN